MKGKNFQLLCLFLDDVAEADSTMFQTVNMEGIPVEKQVIQVNLCSTDIDIVEGAMAEDFAGKSVVKTPTM